MFLDASGLFAALSAREERHAAAVALLQAAPRLLTHNYVLAELVPLSTVRGVPRKTSLGFLRALIDEPKLQMIWIDRSLHLAAMELLEKRVDKAYSLTDAASFVLMRRPRVRKALTTDRHFEQEGFQRLLKT